MIMETQFPKNSLPGTLSVKTGICKPCQLVKDTPVYLDSPLLFSCRYEDRKTKKSDDLELKTVCLLNGGKVMDYFTENDV